MRGPGVGLPAANRLGRSPLTAQHETLFEAEIDQVHHFAQDSCCQGSPGGGPSAKVRASLLLQTQFPPPRLDALQGDGIGGADALGEEGDA